MVNVFRHRLTSSCRTHWYCTRTCGCCTREMHHHHIAVSVDVVTSRECSCSSRSTTNRADHGRHKPHRARVRLPSSARAHRHHCARDGRAAGGHLHPLIQESGLVPRAGIQENVLLVAAAQRLPHIDMRRAVTRCSDAHATPRRDEITLGLRST